MGQELVLYCCPRWICCWYLEFSSGRVWIDLHFSQYCIFILVSPLSSLGYVLDYQVVSLDLVIGVQITKFLCSDFGPSSAKDYSKISCSLAVIDTYIVEGCVSTPWPFPRTFLAHFTEILLIGDTWQFSVRILRKSRLSLIASIVTSYYHLICVLSQDTIGLDCTCLMSELILLKVSFDVWCFMLGKTRVGSLAAYALPTCRDGMLWRVIIESRLWL